MIFWLSFAVTSSVLASTLLLGSVELFGAVVAVTLLPHVFIGDLFHWSRFPQLRRADQALWLSLAALGLGAFLLMRQTGGYALPLFYVYFFAHFWKDLDLAIGQVPAGASSHGLRWPKRWCGLLLVVGYAVVSSGLVRDAHLLTIAKRLAWLIADALLVVSGVSLRRFRRSSKPLDALWARYAGFSASFLFVCTWLDARHPAREILPQAVILWHYTLWYAFYWSALWQRSGPGDVHEPHQGLDRLKYSLAGLTAFALIVNGLSAAGAWLYGFDPEWAWLKYVYNYRYLAGCWTVMHVTWDWLPKQIHGVRLAVL